jgi:hypothetical protein
MYDHGKKKVVLLKEKLYLEGAEFFM